MKMRSHQANLSYTARDYRIAAAGVVAAVVVEATAAVAAAVVAVIAIVTATVAAVVKRLHLRPPVFTQYLNLALPRMEVHF